MNQRVNWLSRQHRDHALEQRGSANVFDGIVEAAVRFEVATLIAAPPSTKNKDKQRDPEMHQSKGNDWHFGLKVHIDVDSASGLVHTVIGTAGNVSDVTQANALLHGDEVAAMGDAGYQGVEKREKNLEKSVTGTSR